MGKVIEVEAVVKVDLGKIDEEDLCDELESRGCLYEEDEADIGDYSMGELLDELEKASSSDWQTMGRTNTHGLYYPNNRPTRGMG